MYTNEQVAVLVKRLDAKIDALVAQRTTLVPAGAPDVATPAQAPVTIPERGEKAEKISCTLHADKVFTVTPAGFASGSGFHFGWCKGQPQAVAA